MTFIYTGILNGKTAFEIDDLDGLRRKVNQINSRAGISEGAQSVEQLGETRPKDDETGVSSADYAGPGYYVTYFDGHAQKFSCEQDALVEIIEERCEVRLANDED